MLFGGENADSYYDEGLTYAMKGDLEKAIEFLRKALAIEPGFAAAWHQLGRCYYRKGDAPTAVDAFNKALAHSKQLLAARVDLGYALLQMRQIDGARKSFSEVLDIRGDHTRAILGLAYCAYQTQQWDVAINIADRMMTTSTAESFEALFLVGRAAYMLQQMDIAGKRLQGADKILEKMIETNEDLLGNYYLRGQIQVLLGDSPSALLALQKAEALARPDAHYTIYHEHFTLVDILAGIGWCYKQVGNEEAAKAAGKRILELKPGSKRGTQLAGEHK